MKNEKNRVLVVPPHDAALKEFIGFFECSPELEPYFYIDYPSQLVDSVKSRGWFVSGSGKEKLGAKSGKQVIIKKLIDNTWVGVFVQAILLKWLFSNRLKKRFLGKADVLSSLIERNNISSAIVSSDRGLGTEAVVLLVASRINAFKVMILSFAYSADYVSSYKLRTSRIYSFLYRQPASIIHRDDAIGNKIFYRPSEAVALEELGILSPNPWVLGAGKCSKMLVDSEREKDRLISLGGESKKYLVTGSSSHDVIFRNFRERKAGRIQICDKYQLRNRKLLLVALPQYWEHGLCGHDRHHRYIQDMLANLVAPNVDVLVSLHPKMKLEDYVYLGRDYEITILEESLSEVLPCVDLFLATYSSTIAWALMCHIPVVIFDHINLNYSDFYSEFNLPVVHDNKNLLLCLQGLSWEEGQTYYDTDLVQKLSPFDGGCVQRIRNEIASLK